MPAASRIDGAIGADEADALFSRLDAAAHVAVAVSGGRDSMALLRLLARWADAEVAKPKLTALTVDHGLRAGSAEEAVRVGAWCKEIGVEHHVLRWMGAKPRTRIQERAREARYALLTDWCRQNAADALTLAHHREDQAETMLMRLARASGVDGLRGMESEIVRDGVRIVRPLLGMARARLDATLRDLGQPWIDDPSNEDSAFERVRLRALRPMFESAGLTAEAIAGSASKLARAAEALDILAARSFSETVDIEAGGYAWIDPERLAGWPEEIVMRVLDRAIEAVGGPAHYSDAALAAAAARIATRETAGFTLGRCRIAMSRGRLLVVRERRGLACLSIEPGRTLVWDDRFAVSLDAREAGVDLCPLGESGFAAARRMEPNLAELPAPAGAALPGGFRGGSLALPPSIHADGTTAALSVRFLRPGGARAGRHEGAR